MMRTLLIAILFLAGCNITSEPEYTLTPEDLEGEWVKYGYHLNYSPVSVDTERCSHDDIVVFIKEHEYGGIAYVIENNIKCHRYNNTGKKALLWWVLKENKLEIGVVRYFHDFAYTSVFGDFEIEKKSRETITLDKELTRYIDDNSFESYNESIDWVRVGDVFQVKESEY